MSPEDGIVRFSPRGCWGEHPLGFGCALTIFHRSPIVQTAVEPLFVVIDSILVNGLTGIGQVVKLFAVKAFVTKLSIESPRHSARDSRVFESLGSSARFGELGR